MHALHVIIKHCIFFKCRPSVHWDDIGVVVIDVEHA